MADRFEDAFQFHSLERFTFKERLIIRAAGFIFAFFLRVIGLTLRFIDDERKIIEDLEDQRIKPILVFWHDRIVTGTYYFRNRNILVLSSTSRDSEYTARCIQRFGFGVIKGSSTRGAVQGLVGMIRAVRAGYTAAFTVDGPKGPRYVAKSGPILLAKKTASPILPFILQPHRYFMLGSWDRLQIPMPFTRVALLVGELIYVDPNADDAEIEAKRDELQRSLDSLVERGNSLFTTTN
ncbi:lysophospholipid acyltransferase family protein [Leptolyngbya sp. 7M]|uniref:lysophospholipid acyltransferase family protein n=1 Tax=Leptolyngbya sp. 7M TaxID=2812896 RepID=UPI001B8C4F9F|nr:lysophospholipid acyltransferase family protein [Leptolyngbya sp. 7M]QYO65567.1 lysophospholipid acyltransferase family protein [Leptolyngbya sp. 7M]